MSRLDFEKIIDPTCDASEQSKARARLLPIFNELLKTAEEKGVSHKGQDVYLGILPARIGEKTAFAVKTETSSILCFSVSYALHTSDDELRGIMSHELGHFVLNHLDRDLPVQAVNRWCNVSVAVYVLFFLCLFNEAFFLTVSHLPPSQQALLHHQEAFLNFNRALAIACVSLWCFMLSRMKKLRVHIHQVEYEADDFAKELGYGTAMASALKKKNDLCDRLVLIFFAPFSTHPTPGARIKRLRSMQQEKEAGFNYRCE